MIFGASFVNRNPMLANMDDLKKIFGEEYPEAVTVLGIRLPLERDGRFLRYYYSEEKRHGSEISKFEDGSATMTLAQLREEWPAWSAKVRRDFVSASGGLHRHSDYPDILRFLMNQDDPQAWSGVALQVAGWLPQGEAFDLLTRALERIESHSANITQGIAATGHPKAIDILREHLEVLWSHPKLWEDNPFTNWNAFDAICCMEHLLQLGVPPAEYAGRARELSKHVCAGTRESCGTFLSRYYDWIPKPDLGALGLSL